MKEESKKEKKRLRNYFIKMRQSLSAKRRFDAKKKLTLQLFAKLDSFRYVLSFASHRNEIDLSELNYHLATENRLILLRVEENDELRPYLISDLHRELEWNNKLSIQEPSPKYCKLFPVANISCALVPGLAFDSNHHRLGYGKGHYDRFLPVLSCPLWGIGFCEQKIEGVLPIESHDISLTEIFLF